MQLIYVYNGNKQGVDEKDWEGDSDIDRADDDFNDCDDGDDNYCDDVDDNDGQVASSSRYSQVPISFVTLHCTQFASCSMMHYTEHNNTL